MNQKNALQLAAAALVGAALGAAAMVWLRAPAPKTEVSVEPITPPSAAPASQVVYEPVAYADLPGWADDNMAEALPAFKKSCAVVAARAPDTETALGDVQFTNADLTAACESVLSAGEGATAMRIAVESAFTPFAVTFSGNPVGLFTGYYEATLRGALTQDGVYQTPIYGVPQNLVSVALKDFIPADQLEGTTVPPTVVGRVVDQKLKPFFTRSEIDLGQAIAGQSDIIAWVDSPVDAHILHIQGSGQIMLGDGTMMRVGFAGHNGHAFRGLGRILIDEGVLTRDTATMIAVRDWLKQNPDRAAALMAQNARYIFFRRIVGDGPIGAQGAPLTPRRSMAVDTRYIPLGLPLWLDTVDPDNDSLRRLVVAQDVGAAITGAVRGDFYWGTGEPAFAKAARMRSQGRYYVLIPKKTEKTSVNE